MAASFDQLNQHKKNVLYEVAVRAYAGTIDGNTANEIAMKLIPYGHPKYRCCIYKEREIIRERSYLAMAKTPEGKEPHPGQFVYVLEAACDDCNIHKVRITDNCRKCLFKPCVKACHVGAIYEMDRKMEIDYKKCVACGMCAKACPYGSILLSDRPCHKACPTGALKYVEDEIAQINYDECINCGRCSASCPFGAISELSFIVPLIDDIRAGKKIVAMVAPAIVGQWGKVTLRQIYDALLAIGFTDIVEVAQGADLTSIYEAREAVEAQKKGVHITTSCCPAFVSLLKKYYPDVYDRHTSDILSPMAITARIARSRFPDAKTVFIGPCVAKKAERLWKRNIGNIDYVLTFEEITAMMKARNVDPTKMEGKAEVENGSASGRGFCITGGVAASLNNYLAEIGSPDRLTIKLADGASECVRLVKELQAGRQTEDVLEGMMCQGGCIAGVDSQVANLYVSKSHAGQENAKISATKIADAEKYKVDCHYDKAAD